MRSVFREFLGFSRLTIERPLILLPHIFLTTTTAMRMVRMARRARLNPTSTCRLRLDPGAGAEPTLGKVSTEI